MLKSNFFKIPKFLVLYVLIFLWVFSGWLHIGNFPGKIKIAEAATTGEVYPTLGTSVAETPWSDNAWTTPTNIYTDNAATANITATSYDSPDQSFVLKATGFDFSSIPDGSTINGVTVRLNSWYRSGQGSGSVDLCQLLNVSMAKVGTNNCATPVALTTTDSTVITKGSASDTWGNTLTAAWIKDPDFGVAIGIAATAANADVDVDYITIEVDYTAPIVEPGPDLYSVSNQRFTIGASATAVSPIVYYGGTPASATAANDILIAIATTSGFMMEWDTADTTATITGSASGKVSTTVSYVGATILKINVTSDFVVDDSITISDLSFKNFTVPEKSGTGGLRVYTGGSTGGTVIATSTSLFTIGSGNVSRIGKPPNYLMANSGITAQYTFDGKDIVSNISDGSGQGNHGRYVAGAGANTATTTAIGKLGQAFDFDGTDDYVTTSSDFIGTGEETITAWIRPRSLGEGSAGRILDNGQVRFYITTSNTVSFSSNNGSTVASSASSAFTTNYGWVHVSVTRLSNGTANIYVNGVLSGSANQSSGTPAAGSSIYIGNNSAGTATFDGLIDALRVYNRELTASEIGFLYRAGSATIDKSFAQGSLSDGLIGWWTMDGKDTHQNFVNRGSTGTKGNLITPGGTATSTFLTAGKVGQAFVGNGLTGASATYIQADADAAFDLTTAVTLCTWVNPKSGGNNGIVGKTLLANTQPDYGFVLAGTNSVLFRASTTMGESDIATPNNAVPFAVWSHLCGTYDKVNQKIYVNGVQANTKVQSLDILNSAGARINMGVYYSTTYTLNGAIDDVRLYNRALSAAEVFDLYTSSQVRVRK